MVTNFIKSSILLFIITIFFLYVNGCSPRYSYHGSYFSKKEISLLKKTKLSKAEIIQILGTPSTKTTFSDNVWYYITQVRKERAYFSVNNVSTDVLIITFNEQNIVKNYKISSGAGSYANIDINQEKTLSAFEKDESFIKDFFSSFRRRLINPISN